MSEMVALLVFVAALSFALGWRVQRYSHACPVMEVPTAPPPVSTPATSPAPEAKPFPVWKVRFVSGSGRVLGDTTYRGRRPQSMTFRTGDGTLGNFVISQYQDGVWVYRRVGVEREPGNR